MLENNGNNVKLWQRRYFKIAIIALGVGMSLTLLALADKYLVASQSEFDTYRISQKHLDDSLLNVVYLNRVLDVHTRDSLFRDVKDDLKDIKRILERLEKSR